MDATYLRQRIAAGEQAIETTTYVQSLLRELLLNIERAELRGTPLAAVHIVQHLADIEDALAVDN